MRRILLAIVLATVAFPAAANASVLSTVSNGTLSITGDAADDRITVRPGSAGVVLVNDQSHAGVTRLAIDSGAGADEIRIDVALPGTIQSGPGADAIAGGPAPETIVAGDDADLVSGGAGEDTILLGAGNDTALETDGSVDGQSGTDTVRFTGTDESEEFTLQALGTHARIVRDTGGFADLVRVETAEVLAGGGPDFVDVGDLSATELTRLDTDLGLFDGAPDSVVAAGTGANDGIGASMLGDDLRISGLKADLRVENADADRVTVQGHGGDDKLTAIGTVPPGLTLEGNEGADDLTGAASAEILRGGPGNDRARGNGGADRIELGDGDDVATFRLTDGADTITGDGGADRLTVQGTAADDLVEVRATQVGAANVAGVETVEPAPGSGRDTVAVGDLTGSAIKTVAVDLGGPDQRLDTVSIAGTAGTDKIKLAAAGAGYAATGLAATVTIDTTDPGQKIVVDGGEGDDEIDASAMTKDKTQPFLNGGPGKDVVLGTPGQDVISGGTGVDVALLAGGLDTYTWVPGDGGDIVEGGAGTDFLQMDGTTAGDSFSVTPVGVRTRARLNNEVVDIGDLERLDLFPAAGPDQIHVADLSGTDVTNVDLTLAVARNVVTPDGSQDFLAVDGTNGNDNITVTAGGPEVRAKGLAATTVARFADKAQDRFHIDTRLGRDSLLVDAGVHQLLLFTSI